MHQKHFNMQIAIWQLLIMCVPKQTDKPEAETDANKKNSFLNCQGGNGQGI